MISVQLTGGLGNQMFAYAAGLSASHRLGVDLGIVREIDVEGRPYLLDRLRVPQDRVVDPIARGRVGRRIQRLFPDRGRYRETAFYYEDKFEDVQDGMRLEGYFQSWRYGAPVEAALRSHFQLADDLTETSRSVARKIEAASVAVSLHVRRGDYLKPKHVGMHGLLDMEYYRRAVQLVRAMTKAEPRFFVFSDDLDWAVENIAKGVDAVPVRGNEASPWEDMALMSKCQHHVIANSSFSWWGAWMNPSPEKIVVAPRAWFSAAGLRRNNTCDLYPPGWYLA